MCLIIVKKSGVNLPPLEHLTNAEKTNSDGIGICYKKNGNMVKIKKDFKNAQELHQFLLANIEISDPLIIHFRFATHGLKDIGNRHPFPITKNKSLLRKPLLNCSVALAHNGVLTQFNNHHKFSDTQKLILNVLSEPSIKNNLENKAIQTLIENFIGSDKLAILNSKIIMFGKYIEDKGIYYSNTSYRASVIGYQQNNSNLDYFHTCDGCKKTKSVDYVQVDGMYSDYLLLCKKCQKKLEKDKLYILGDEDEQCENCLQFFKPNTLKLTHYGKLCPKCEREYIY